MVFSLDCVLVSCIYDEYEMIKTRKTRLLHVATVRKKVQAAPPLATSWSKNANNKNTQTYIIRVHIYQGKENTQIYIIRVLTYQRKKITQIPIVWSCNCFRIQTTTWELGWSGALTNTSLIYYNLLHGVVWMIQYHLVREKDFEGKVISLH